jgi:hypothetical protein
MFSNRGRTVATIRARRPMVADSDDCGPAAIWNVIAVGFRDPLGPFIYTLF